jgi:hypothetical protein
MYRSRCIGHPGLTPQRIDRLTLGGYILCRREPPWKKRWRCPATIPSRPVAVDHRLSNTTYHIDFRLVLSSRALSPRHPMSARCCLGSPQSAARSERDSVVLTSRSGRKCSHASACLYLGPDPVDHNSSPDVRGRVRR